MSIGARPGEAYKPRSWETNQDVFPLLDGGQHAEAKRLLIQALDEYEEKSEPLYDLACAEAQLEESDAALEHLREPSRPVRRLPTMQWAITSLSR